MESLNKRVLLAERLSYLLERSGKYNMNERRLRFLCIEIYRTLNGLNPSFMKEIFEKRKNNRVHNS